MPTGAMLPVDGHETWGGGRYCVVSTPDDERLLYEGHDPNTAVEIAEWFVARYGVQPKMEVEW